MGVEVLKFYGVGVLKGSNGVRRGEIVEGRDDEVSMGEGGYLGFGRWVGGGGNKRIDKVEKWGMYDDRVREEK